MISALALSIAVLRVDPPSAAPVSPPPTPTATAAVTTAASTPAATPSAVTWLGVTLGQSSRGVRAELGKPREIIPISVGEQWRYDVDSGAVSLELIFDQDQVVSISASTAPGKQSTLADPAGGALGMPAAALQSARGTPIAAYDNGQQVAYGDPNGIRWFYTIGTGAVTRISVSAPLPASPASQVVADASHDGSSEAKAFIVNAATQGDATNAEVGELRSLTCDDGGVWQIVTQELATAGGRYYDIYHVACSTNHQLHDYYFDVTQSASHI
jgi:hypothetical protein